MATIQLRQLESAWALRALDLAQPSGGSPGFDDQLGRVGGEVGEDDLGDAGVEQVALRTVRELAGVDRPARDLRVARPGPLVTVARIVRGAVQGEPRIPAQVGPLARAHHRPEPQLTAGELRLDPADARRPVGPQGRDRLVPACLEQGPNAPGELRLGPFEVPPRDGLAAGFFAHGSGIYYSSRLSGSREEA